MSDVFRKEYRLLSDQHKAFMNSFKDKAKELLTDYQDSAKELGTTVDGRYMSLAITNLEQSIMWAIKSIT